MKKNVAGQAIGAQMVSATDGSAFTGSVTVSVTGDAGTQGTGSVGAGACAHEGNGYHTYAPAQAETNFALIAFTFTGSGAIPATVQVFTTFPQTGDSFPLLPAALVSGRMDNSVGAMAANVLTATAINADAITDAKVASDVTIASVTGAVGSVTGAVGSVTGAVGSLGAQAKADVNAEMVDALATDTYAEPGQGAPAATAAIATKLNWLYKWTRNKKDNDGTTTKYYADDAATVDQKQATSEAAGTVTKGEIASGP